MIVNEHCRKARSQSPPGPSIYDRFRLKYLSPNSPKRTKAPTMYMKVLKGKKEKNRSLILDAIHIKAKKAIETMPRPFINR